MPTCLYALHVSCLSETEAELVKPWLQEKAVCLRLSWMSGKHERTSVASSPWLQRVVEIRIWCHSFDIDHTSCLPSVQKTYVPQDTWAGREDGQYRWSKKFALATNDSHCVLHERVNANRPVASAMGLDLSNVPFSHDNGYTQNAAARGLGLVDRLLARCRLFPCWDPSCIAKSRTWHTRWSQRSYLPFNVGSCS